MIMTIITYDFSCVGIETIYNSSVGMRAMNYIIIKSYFFSMLIMQSNKSTEYILY